MSTINFEDDRDTALQHLRSGWYTELHDDPEDSAFYLLELHRRNSVTVIGKIHKSAFDNEEFTKDSIIPITGKD